MNTSVTNSVHQNQLIVKSAECERKVSIMNKRIQLVTVAVALVGLMSAVPVQANTNVIPPVTANRFAINQPASKDAGIYPIGPEADLYLQHLPSSTNWISQLAPNALLHPTGPEADPYLQHRPLSTNWISRIAPNARLYPTGPEADLYFQHFNR